jgi:hypothetical protein
MNTLYISAWRSVAFPGFAAPVCGFKHAALSQYLNLKLIWPPLHDVIPKIQPALYFLEGSRILCRV